MSHLPRIDTPCPLRAEQQRGIDGHCAHCDRHVHKLDALDDAARRALFDAADGAICVSYRVPAARRVGPVGALIAATLITTSALAADPAAAPPTTGSRIVRETPRDLDPVHIVGAVNDPQDAKAAPDTSRPALPEQDAKAVDQIEVLMGGVSDPGNAVWVETDDDAPALPMREAEDGR